jgi:peptidyl-tRNA hydrolase, PTH1 family
VKLVVGLGNPGEQYARSRHNTGFMVVDYLVKGKILSPSIDKKSDSIIYKMGEEAVFQKPQTFMNLSGRSVAALANFYKIETTNILVVHDEVDLPFGEIKHQFDRGPAGHNGVISVIQSLGSQEFHRLRVGIGRPENSSFEVHDWVLQDFKEDEDDVEKLLQRATEVVANWIKAD